VDPSAANLDVHERHGLWRRNPNGDPSRAGRVEIAPEKSSACSIALIVGQPWMMVAMASKLCGAQYGHCCRRLSVRRRVLRPELVNS